MEYNCFLDDIRTVGKLLLKFRSKNRSYIPSRKWRKQFKDRVLFPATEFVQKALRSIDTERCIYQTERSESHVKSSFQQLYNYTRAV
jgi:hypothetical protein